ncbi:MAG: NAD(P)H-dependent oxidoreductase [Clostridia bacterium]|nr:NAD(P)H-dependent oxidoreductase [Clostridia bacterium]
MKILIVNGSPKGKYSITLQTCRYLELLNPGHEFKVLHAGQQIKKLQRDFSSAEEMLREAELIIFSYPVYTFIAPCQLHYFIDLMKKTDIDWSEKFATQITTSKHFYDVTAHKYVEDNCHDMGLKVIKGLSADMDDLTTEKGQKEAEEFFKLTVWSCENDYHEAYVAPAKPKKAVKVNPASGVVAKGSGQVVIVTDCEKDNKQLSAMINRFRAVLPISSKVVNIGEYPIKGGCLGCFKCAVTGKCVYKDGFDDFLRNEIQSGSAIVYAFTIKDHSMGPRFKMYDDRQFCNGHRTVTMGMPVGYLVSGEYSKEANLQMILEGRSEVGGNFLAGVATDEVNPDSEIDRLARTLAWAVQHKYTRPANFYGVGGMKIFRDLIYIMQGLMKADHKFYKAHGQYDFPQKQRPRMLAMYLVGGLMALPAKKIPANAMNEGMLMPYKSALDKAKKIAEKMKAENE